MKQKITEDDLMKLIDDYVATGGEDYWQDDQGWNKDDILAGREKAKAARASVVDALKELYTQ